MFQWSVISYGTYLFYLKISVYQYGHSALRERLGARLNAISPYLLISHTKLVSTFTQVVHTGMRKLLLEKVAQLG